MTTKNKRSSIVSYKKQNISKEDLDLINNCADHNTTLNLENFKRKYSEDRRNILRKELKEIFYV